MLHVGVRAMWDGGSAIGMVIVIGDSGFCPYFVSFESSEFVLHPGFLFLLLFFLSLLLEPLAFFLFLLLLLLGLTLIL